MADCRAGMENTGFTYNTLCHKARNYSENIGDMKKYTEASFTGLLRLHQKQFELYNLLNKIRKHGSMLIN